MVVQGRLVMETIMNSWPILRKVRAQQTRTVTGRIQMVHNGKINKGEIKMKKIFVSGAFMFLLSLVVTNIYAGMFPKGYFRWVKGEFEIPDEIKKVTKVSELQPFLDNKRDFTRMAAIRRLGQIEGPRAIDLLVKRFAREPIYRGIEGFPLVKFEIIRTLGRFGTKKAKFTLLGLLKDYWKRVPIPNEKKGVAPDRDSETVTPVILETLYKWSGEKDVFKTVKIIALSEDVENFYGGRNSIGQRAWEVYLKGEMISKGIVGGKDTAIYLLDYEESIIKEGLDTVPFVSLKISASRNILEERLSESTLSSLVSEFEDQFKKEPRTPKGSLTKRHHTLISRISYIKEILKEKREKEEMKKKKEMKEKSSKK